MPTLSVGKTNVGQVGNLPPIVNRRASGFRKTKSRRGVTLIEMMVVVMIIALFAAIVGPKLFNKVDWAKVEAARVQIRSLDGAPGGDGINADIVSWKN
jgi:prepilin-type N-terminal cleavage/methylation domain-containing protein